MLKYLKDRIPLIIITAIVTLALSSFITASNTVPAPAETYSYKVVAAPGNAKELEERLGKLGKNGWELVTLMNRGEGRVFIVLTK